MSDDNNWEAIVQTLQQPLAPIEDKYRMLFCSRQAAPSKPVLIEALVQALAGEQSVLMRHEIAYVMGQVGDESAIPALVRMLDDQDEDEVTRHEAAEGLAAIDAEGSIQHFERYASSESLPLLAQTCELAIEATRKRDLPGAIPVCVCQQYEKVTTERSIEYQSVDPAGGIEGATMTDIPIMGEQLADESAPLYTRYQAMFTLRNLGGPSAVKQLADGLRSDSSSPCFRHEVAFVLGQMEEENATEALIEALARPDEHAVVRHEAAIALGSIGGDAGEAALQQFKDDVVPMVAESCQAALSTLAYWKKWEELEARLAIQ